MGRVIFLDMHCIFMEYFTFQISMTMLSSLRVDQSDSIILSQTLVDSMAPTRCVADINQIIITPMLKQPGVMTDGELAEFILKPDL